jgi:glycosyltransferase involved in cell wall biosynthesis
VPEVVPHGVAGWLSDPGDIAGMIEDSVRILLDDTAWRAASAAARKAAETFSADVVVPRYEQCYREVLAR